MHNFTTSDIEGLLNTRRQDEWLGNSRHVILRYSIDGMDYAFKFMSPHGADAHMTNHALFTEFGMNFIDQQHIRVDPKKCKAVYNNSHAPVHNDIIITEFQNLPRLSEWDSAHNHAAQACHDQVLKHAVPIVACDHWDMRSKNIFVKNENGNNTLLFFDPEFGLGTYNNTHYIEHAPIETFSKLQQVHAKDLVREQKVELMRKTKEECAVWEEKIRSGKILKSDTLNPYRKQTLHRVQELKAKL